MANGQENLIPFSERSKEEARESGRKGGQASVRTRRRKKLLKDYLESALNTKNMDGRSRIDEITIALIREACAGNVKAYEVIRDTLGQKPLEKIQAQVDLPVFIDDIDE